jgi:hypothetical protein
VRAGGWDARAYVESLLGGPSGLREDKEILFSGGDNTQNFTELGRGHPEHLTGESSRAGAGNTQESGRPSGACSQSAIAISSESEEVDESESEGRISNPEF